jgi:hypothetical protein
MSDGEKLTFQGPAPLHHQDLMWTKLVPEMAIFNQLTQPIVREDFIKHINKFYITTSLFIKFLTV